MQSPRSRPKVAFGVLVENAYLKPGATLTDTRRRWRATVRAAGSLLSDCGQAGSIHKLGATLPGAPACNGWTFWHYQAAPGLTPIYALRQTSISATPPMRHPHHTPPSDDQGPTSANRRVMAKWANPANTL